MQTHELVVTSKYWLALTDIGNKEGRLAAWPPLAAEVRWEEEAVVFPGGRDDLGGAALLSSTFLVCSPPVPLSCSRRACAGGQHVSTGAPPVREVWPGRQMQTETVLACAGWQQEGASRLGEEQASPRSC